MGKRGMVAAVLLGIVAGWSGIATAEASDWYLSGQATYSEPDNTRLTEEAWGGTLRLGTAVADLIDLELVGGMLGYSRDVNTDHEYRYILGLDALLVFNRGGFSPHLAIGGGAAYNDALFGGESVSGYVDAGLGFRIPLIEDGLRLRFDARYLLNFTDEVIINDDQLGGLRVSLGVEVPLGSAEPERVDTDGDGVLDRRDQCPNTPPGVAVGADGCARDLDDDGVPASRDRCPGTSMGVPVGSDGCPRDSDGDGVADYKDQCPNTPAGTRVNNSGCPVTVDTDGDGVPDDQDLCPDTPPGAKVLTNGCAVGQSVVLQGVHFAFDKATLTSSSRDILRRVARTLKDSPGFRVMLAGHTDSRGSAQYNLALSRRRADAVRDFLVNHGVDPSRLVTRGYGETRPTATNATKTGRALNRRTELRVIGER